MRSMTGHGGARLRERGLDIEVEIRSVNHRFFNLKVNLPPALSRREPEIEKIIRSRVSRGSVVVSAAVKSTAGPGAALPDDRTVGEIYRRLRRMQKKLKIPGAVSMEALLGMPHLWSSDGKEDEAERLWPRIRRLVARAADDLVRMREREGRGMRRDLQKHLRRIETLTGKIGRRAPRVRRAYEKKLRDRVNAMTARHGVEVEPSDLVREVAIYAERSDISEELQRLRSHVRQFRKILGQDGPVGRKLDFLTQEMGREANTLAAKGGDSEVSVLAVEVKAEIEKIKEQAENVE